MAINGTYLFKTVKQLLKEQDKLRFDHAVQRGYTWRLENKSLFIHSLMYGYPFPPCYSISEDNEVYYFLDGKQRISTVLSYIQGLWSLSAKTSNINGEKVAHKFFADLSEELQDRIFDATFQIYIYKELTEEETHELFLRLNGGVPLSKFEKLRVVAPDEVLESIQKIKLSTFFANSVAISEYQKTRFRDEELILQIMMILENDKRGVDLYTKSIKKYMENIGKTFISPDILIELQATTDYLGLAIPTYHKHMKKSHIPSVFITACTAREKGVEPELFRLWVDSFFKRYMGFQSYTFALIGSAKRTHVQARINEMGKDFNEFVAKYRNKESILAL